MFRPIRLGVAGLLSLGLAISVASLSHQQTYAQGACVTQVPGAVAWYPGDGDTKDFARANTGTLQGNTAYAGGHAGQGFLFDGNTDAVRVGNPTHLHLQTLTIEAWVKRNSTTQTTLDSLNGGSIFSYGLNGYTFHLLNNGHLAFGKVGVNAVESSVQGFTPELKISDTAFHHVAVVKSGTTVTFYLDGVASAGFVYGNAFEFTTNAAVGARGDTFLNSLHGVVDELTIYDRALLPADIQAILAAGAAGKCKETRVSLQHATYPNGEASGPYDLTVRRTGDATAASTVAYATADGTALAGQDYTATSGTLTFGVGELVKTIQVPVTNDTAAEADETFQIALSSPSGAAVVPTSSATLTLFNTVPGPGRIIVPSTHLGSFGSGLLAYNTDGSNGIQLTSVEYGTNTAFSSVARRTGQIAFEACGDYPATTCEQGRRLFVMNADGSGRRQVTTSAGLTLPFSQQDTDPVISPDGTKIAFRSGRPPAQRLREEIFVINTDGTGLRLITPKQNANQGNDESYAYSAAWSPDSAKLLVHAFREPPGIIGSLYTYNPDGTGETLLVRGMSNSLAGTVAIDWAPDGRYILYATAAGAQHPATGYLLADPQEPGKTRFLGLPELVGTGAVTYNAGSVRFSPDGQRIVYGAVGAGSGSTTFGSVRTINLDGTNPSNVRTNTAEYARDKWWWGGPALPVAARFELTPEQVLVWNGKGAVLAPTLFDAQNNVIFRAAQWEDTPETGRQCTAALPACINPNVFPRINALGEITGSVGNGEINWCAANAGFTDCIRVQNYDTPVLSVRASSPTASRATGAAGVFTITRLGRSGTSLLINISLSGTAVRNTDYTIDVTGGTLSGNTISTAPSQETITVNVRPLGGTGDRTVIFTLQPTTTFAYALNDSAKSATVTVTGDAPATFRLSAVTPNIGGNTGPVTVTVHGQQLIPGSAVKLVRAGQPDIAGSAVQIAANAVSLTAVLDLKGKSLGVWTVVVTGPDGRFATLPNAFTIEAGRPTEVWVRITGREAVRIGSPAKVYFAYGNTANVDAPPTMLRVSIPSGIALTAAPKLPDGSFPNLYTDDNGTLLEFFVPAVAASSTTYVAMDLFTSTDIPLGLFPITASAVSSDLLKAAAEVQVNPAVTMTVETTVATESHEQTVYHVKSPTGNYDIVEDASLSETDLAGTSATIEQSGSTVAFVLEFPVPDAPTTISAGRDVSNAVVAGDFTLTSVEPKRGAGGHVLLTIRGASLKPGVKIKLARKGFADIASRGFPSVSTDGRFALAPFKFDLKAIGVWDVVVTDLDGTVKKLDKGFTLAAAYKSKHHVPDLPPPATPPGKKVAAAVVAAPGGPANQTPAPTPPDTQGAAAAKARQAALDALKATRPTGDKQVKELQDALDALQAALLAARKPKSGLPVDKGRSKTEAIKKIDEGLFTLLPGTFLPFSQPPAPKPGPGPKFEEVIDYLPEPLLPNPPENIVTKIIKWIFKIRPVFSFDPNDKAGPQGGGTQHHIAGSDPMPYVVFFENKPEATAPAQDVTITDQLDVTKFDLSTFEVGPVSFGTRLVSPPPGLKLWTTDVDLRPANNLIVAINVALDPATGIIRWTFVSLDPATGLPTDDALAGFLPPNKTSPEGEGSVVFSVRPKADLTTGAEIRNQAQIVFDVNAPIDTPVWLNTIDKALPVSQVTALAATQPSTSFQVQWSGSDQGAGIESYRIYVSEDDKPFHVWMTDTTETSGTFTGELNKTYKFFSLTRDLAGNEQVSTGAAQASTQVTFSAAADDKDGDGLRDAWESQFGLDPASAAGLNGGSADADGDGRTNAQEQQSGTHPRGVHVRYLAEGATGSFFRTAIALANAHPTQAGIALLRFLKSDGTISTHTISVPALARRTVDVGSLPGFATAEFSTVVESDELMVIDRTMSWDTRGYGSHAETAIAEPRQTWYLAEGATHSSFDLFYLIQNPSAATANVQVTYLLPAPAAPVVKAYTVNPNSRFNIWVDVEDPRLANTDVSAVITSPELPIIVERAMYLNAGGLPFGAGHNSAGVTAPATNWFLAEGATGPYFDLFVLIANPTDSDALVDARYLLPDGSVVSKSYTVAANSRFNIYVDLQDARLANTAVSTTLTSTNDVPIIVERAMWWPGSGATWQEAHNSPGSAVTGTRWGLAEGELGGQNGLETYILIANTSPSAGSAKVTLLFEDGATAERTFPLNPNSRFNVNVAADFPSAIGKRFGAIVESLGVTPSPIVVERAMYSNAGGVIWAAGTNALATRLQ